MDHCVGQIRKSLHSDLFAAADVHEVRLFKRAIQFWKAREESFRTVCVRTRDSRALKGALDPRVVGLREFVRLA